MATLMRGVRRGELPQVFDLLAECFPRAAREMFAAETEQDSTFRLRHGRVAVVDGQISGYVRIFARTMLVRGVPVAAGGIGSVATRGDARGSGIATRLLRDAIAQMRREGMRVSFLFTGIAGFYERVGFRVVPQPFFTADAREAAGAGTASEYEIRSAGERDQPKMLEIYGAGVAQSTGAIARTLRTWRDAAGWLDEDAGGAFVAERDGAVVAYIRSRCRTYGHWILEAEHLPGHAAAIAPLVAAVARRAIEHGEQIGALAPDDHALATVLRRLPSTQESAPPYPMMMRALDDDPALADAIARETVHFWHTDRI